MPMTPLPYRVTDKRWETADTVTLTLAPVDRAVEAPQPGQFLMLWAFGVGRGADLDQRTARPVDQLEHTIRAAGPATPHPHRLRRSATWSGCGGPSAPGGRSSGPTGATCSSSPAGSGWLRCGRPSTRPWSIGTGSGRWPLLVGARSPDDLVFRGELDAWRDRTGLQVEITVDYAPGGGDDRWTGDVGLVTELVRQADVSTRVDGALVCGPEVMMRYAAQALLDRGVPARSIRCRGAQHAVRHRTLRSLPARARFVCLDGPVFGHPDLRPPARPCGSDELRRASRRLAVWKFASCDGCQLTLLDCEDELLDVAGAVEIAYFLEASSATVDGPYDLSLVEGSITTPPTSNASARSAPSSRAPRHHRRLRHRRRDPGAAQLQPTSRSSSPSSTPTPTTSRPSTTSTPISAHVPVDFELRGCPIDRGQLLEVITRLPRTDGRPNVAGHSVCVECKAPGNVCVMVATGRPASARSPTRAAARSAPPTTVAATAASGPAETPQPAALVPALTRLGMERRRRRPGVPHVQRLGR